MAEQEAPSPSSNEVLDRLMENFEETLRHQDSEDETSSEDEEQFHDASDSLNKPEPERVLDRDEPDRLDSLTNDRLSFNEEFSNNMESDLPNPDELSGGASCMPDRDEDHSNENEDDDNDPEEESLEEELKRLEPLLSEEEKEARKEEAQAHKARGNLIFKEQNFDEAYDAYTDALKLCPLCFAKERSIMYSNRAACLMRNEKYEEAIKDSTKALELNPAYLKCLLRRAELYEKTDKLEDALADYEKVIEMDPSIHSARAACMRLPEQIKERNEKMKEEMIGKLKDLGNMILKPFGLSTNNFQLNQDPNTGGYSVNFQQ